MTTLSLSLPHSLYRAEQVREGERRAARQLDIELFTLMERAGQALFELVQRQCASATELLVCCGGGNNGGDGYIVARLARKAGLNVTVWHAGDPQQLRGDASKAKQLWLQEGGKIDVPNDEIDSRFDVIVDALLGTGLTGDVRPSMHLLIEAINHSAAYVISADVPSGLDADTGACCGGAVKADATLTFIGVKRGLMTGLGPEYCGELHFAGLGIEAEFTSLEPVECVRVMAPDVEPHFLPRKRTAHKGDHGRLAVLGGDLGMGGAIRLASEAALRSGAGLVSVLTQPEHVMPLLAARPELMVRGWQDTAQTVTQLIDWADVVVAGPGLGQSDWGQALAFYLRDLSKPQVIDADGLNLLAFSPDYNSQRIITPHPGEAARLLGITVAEVEANRFLAVEQLQQRYGGVVILKGAGTIVFNGHQTWLVTEGNPGMASGGMGDVLSGILGALVAQGLSLSHAAVCGTWLHSRAADLCSKQGERGMLASDLFPYIRQLVNPDQHDATYL